jgi:SagB-type dehydrogenase family enzyme
MFRRQYVTALLAGVFGALAGCTGDGSDRQTTAEPTADTTTEPLPDSTTEAAVEGGSLPPPRTETGAMIVAEAIDGRRSRREYAAEPLTAAEFGQLLWAGQGITKHRTGRDGLRAAPSAGALYPLELFAAVGTDGVRGFDPGLYHYEPSAHSVERRRSGDHRDRLAAIAIEQSWIAAAPVVFVLTAVDERTTGKYGERGRRRYVPMEAGHVGQNVYLQAEALGLSTVTVGAFRDGDLRDLLGVSAAHRPLSVMPVGKRN